MIEIELQCYKADPLYKYGSNISTQTENENKNLSRT